MKFKNIHQMESQHVIIKPDAAGAPERINKWSEAAAKTITSFKNNHPGKYVLVKLVLTSCDLEEEEQEHV